MAQPVEGAGASCIAIVDKVGRVWISEHRCVGERVPGGGFTFWRGASPSLAYIERDRPVQEGPYQILTLDGMGVAHHARGDTISGYCRGGGASILAIGNGCIPYNTCGMCHSGSSPMAKWERRELRCVTRDDHDAIKPGEVRLCGCRRPDVTDCRARKRIRKRDGDITVYWTTGKSKQEPRCQCIRCISRWPLARYRYTWEDYPCKDSFHSIYCKFGGVDELIVIILYAAYQYGSGDWRQCAAGLFLKPDLQRLRSSLSQSRLAGSVGHHPEADGREGDVPQGCEPSRVSKDPEGGTEAWSQHDVTAKEEQRERKRAKRRMRAYQRKHDKLSEYWGSYVKTGEGVYVRRDAT